VKAFRHPRGRKTPTPALGSGVNTAPQGAPAPPALLPTGDAAAYLGLTRQKLITIAGFLALPAVLQPHPKRRGGSPAKHYHRSVLDQAAELSRQCKAVGAGKVLPKARRRARRP